MSLLEPEHHLISFENKGDYIEVTCTCGYVAKTGASKDKGVLEVFAHALERRHLTLNTKTNH